jgi:tetratricopeptide (TPR) repeat protein
LEELQGATKLDARNPGLLSALGGVYLALNQVPAAAAQFNLALGIDASNVVARMGLADVALRSGDLEGAKAAYRAVLKTDAENSAAQNNLAWILADQGKDLEEALTLATAATRREPDYADGQDTLGWVHYRRGEYPQAITAFSSAKKLAPTRGDIAAHLGMAYAKAGRKQEALVELRRALSLKGDLPNRREVEALVATLAK